MTHHLTDEQLGATRDGALPAGAAAAAESHLAECAECRERLAELVALDVALAGALEHDPGEEYFAAFAGRVADRIANAVPAAAPRRGLAAWWSSPRRLAWAGGALALVAVAALVVTLAREHGPQEFAMRSGPAPLLGVRAARPAAPAESAPAGIAAPRQEANGAGAVQKTLEDEAHDELPSPRLSAQRRADVPRAAAAPRNFAATRAPAREPVAGSEKARARLSEPQHVLEVRTLPNGEQEVVQRQQQFAPAPTPAPAAPAPATLQAPRQFMKPRAMPLGSQSLAGGAATAKEAPERKLAQAPAQAAAERAEDITLNGTVAAATICGEVHDARGRPAAGAQVTLVETGRSVSAGVNGAFCVDAPATGGTLYVLAVGYRPYRTHVTAGGTAAPVSVTLAAVDVLSSPVAGWTGSRADSRVGMLDATGRRTSLPRRAAVDASAAAARAGTAEAWSKAAERWETVALFERSASDAEPGFRVAEARVNAWLVGHTDAQRMAAAGATRAFLEHAQPGSWRDIALDWQAALER